MQSNVAHLNPSLADPELRAMINVLCEIWESEDQNMIKWAKVEFARSFYDYLYPRISPPVKMSKSKRKKR